MEKIITAVIPHLMCPGTPITLQPAALSGIQREKGDVLEQNGSVELLMELLVELLMELLK